MVREESQGVFSEFLRLSVVQLKATWRAKSLTFGHFLVVLFPPPSPSVHTETSRYV